MVFTHGPAAHLPRLATRAGLGKIIRSLDVARFVQGGVVKTFRYVTSEFGDVTVTGNDAKNLHCVIVLAMEYHVAPYEVAPHVAAQPGLQFAHFWLRRN